MAREDGPIVVCVINLKGGVGKSTISALLSRHALRTRDADVLAIDLDPQANLSQALMGQNYDRLLRQQLPSIVEVFKGYNPPSGNRRNASSLNPVAAVQTIETRKTRTLDLLPSRFDFSDALTDAIRPDPQVLAKFLSANFQEKDLIIIDCAPTESILTMAAYHASGLVLVPVKPEYFATIGFPLLQESLTKFRKSNRSNRIEVSGIVINNGFYHGGNNGGPEKTRAMDEIRAEAGKNKWKIFQNQLPFSRGFPKIMRGDYNYLGNATMFYQFANEFFNEIGL